MSVSEAMMNVVENGGEEFILARDKKQVESMRVMAFNLKKKVPKQLIEDIGIQKLEEDGRFFLRIYKRNIMEAERWIRDSETGKLIPAAVNKTDTFETQRTIQLMRKDGISEEDITKALAE